MARNILGASRNNSSAGCADVCGIGEEYDYSRLDSI